MRFPRRQTPRRGSTLVEGAIVLMAFLTLIVGTIDLGLAVLRYNGASQAARSAARLAIVRGNITPRATSSWGPGAVTVKGDDTASEISNAVRPYLAGLDPSKVTIKLEWPASTNAPDDQVKVTITTTYQPMLTFVLGSSAINLSASSTMRIAF